MLGLISLDQASENSAGLQGDFDVVATLDILESHDAHWPNKTFLPIHNHYKKNVCKTMDTFLWVSETPWNDCKIIYDQNLIHSEILKKFLGVCAQCATLIGMNEAPSWKVFLIHAWFGTLDVDIIY